MINNILYTIKLDKPPFSKVSNLDFGIQSAYFDNLPCLMENRYSNFWYLEHYTVHVIEKNKPYILNFQRRDGHSCTCTCLEHPELANHLLTIKNLDFKNIEDILYAWFHSNNISQVVVKSCLNPISCWFFSTYYGSFIFKNDMWEWNFEDVTKKVSILSESDLIKQPYTFKTLNEGIDFIVKKYEQIFLKYNENYFNSDIIW